MIIWKIKFVTLILLAGLICIMPPVPTGAYYESTIASVSVSGSDGYWDIKDHSLCGQSFTATKDRLDEILLFLSGNGARQAVTLELFHMGPGDGGGDLVAQGAVAASENPSWNSFSFSSIALVVGESYTMRVTTPELNDIFWYVKHNNPYAGGQSIRDNNWAPGDDFGFIVYGHNVAEEDSNPPVAPPAPPADQPASSPADQPAASPSNPGGSNSQASNPTSSTPAFTSTGGAETATSTATDQPKVTESKVESLIKNKVVWVLAGAIILLAALSVVLIIKLRKQSKKSKDGKQK